MSREPTQYERQLMETLGFETLEELIKFLNLPVVENLNMQPPDASESTRWDEWVDKEWEREQAQKKKLS